MSSVDVIVPCYRYGHFLRQCVSSVLSQSGVDVRILIIDDASPDNTAHVATELVKEDQRVTFIKHVDNKGHIATYNEGIEWASADYMLLLSADDYLLPGALCRAATIMDTHSEVGFTFGNVVELTDSGIEIPRRSGAALPQETDCILQGIEFIKLSGAEVLVNTCTAVVRTTAQKLAGGYRTELPHAGDMEMWLRLAARSAVGFVTAYQGVYRRHSANMSSAHYYYTPNGQFVYTFHGRLTDLQQRKTAIDYFFKDHVGSLPNSERLREKMLRSLAGLAIGSASAAFNEGELEQSRKLSDFACETCPQIKTSLGWAKLACKLRMGSKAWRALQPLAESVRRRIH
jgi:glycosyltransferase involved in cell wall biosynthesis